MGTARIVGALVALVSLAATPGEAVDQSSELQQVLEAAGRYLAEFGRAADGVVIEEDYFHEGRAQTVQARRVRADLAFLADPRFGWVEFRDVVEVDGKAVADRETRAVDLFAKPDANALEQVRRIIREGARFNLTPVGLSVDRTTNLPTAALRFFSRENHRRATAADVVESGATDSTTSAAVARRWCTSPKRSGRG
jgi:hypothetical protein